MTRYSDTVHRLLVLPVLVLVGCSASQEVAKAPAAKGELELISKPKATGGKVHPLAKNLELAGFRISEPKAGTLRVKFNVINHSQADLGDLDLVVALMPAGSNANDTPLCVVKVKVNGLGPEESKPVEATTETRLRVYELPDWQFIRAVFDITTP